MDVTDVDRIRKKFNEDEQVTFPREDVATLLRYISMLEKMPTILCSEWEHKQYEAQWTESKLKLEAESSEGEKG